MIHEFDATLKKLEGRIQWTVFYVPFSIDEVYGTRGRVKIRATIDGYDFAGTLLPSRNGHYMVYNKQLRAACGKDLGEKVHVVLERDIEPGTVAVPGELLEELRRQPAALEAFERLPYYRKREEVNKILDAKRQATRERRLQKLIEVLGDRDGWGVHGFGASLETGTLQPRRTDTVLVSRQWRELNRIEPAAFLTLVLVFVAWLIPVAILGSIAGHLGRISRILDELTWNLPESQKNDEERPDSTSSEGVDNG